MIDDLIPKHFSLGVLQSFFFFTAGISLYLFRLWLRHPRLGVDQLETETNRGVLLVVWIEPSKYLNEALGSTLK